MSRKMRIDLNSDVGGSFGAYPIGFDEEVISHLTSANIACGFHAGDPGVMRKTVAIFGLRNEVRNTKLKRWAYIPESGSF